MAEYTITARPSGSSQNNNASRIISTYFPYDATRHRTISSITRKNGIWCSCGGASQRVTLNGYDRLIDTQTGEVVKKSNTASCTCHGTGPASENYMTTSFTNWTEDESNLAVTLWAAGRLKIARTVWIKSYTSSDHGSPTFRDGYYNDDITIKGSTIPFTEYLPQVAKFEVMRSANGVTPDDMSATVWARIKLAMNDTSGLSDSPKLVLRHATHQNMAGADETEITSIPIANYLTAEQLVRLGTAYGIGSSHYFQLAFSAGEEAARSIIASVGMANVPLHINGTNSGASVGMYSNAAPGDERFESAWKSYFYAGLGAVGDSGGSQTALGIQCGTITFGSVSADTVKNIDVTFQTAFDPGTAPVVALGLGYSSTNAVFGSVSCAVSDISNTGFTAHVFNNCGLTRNDISCPWIAVGTAIGGGVSPAMALSMITSGRQFDDEGEGISDEEALRIITNE